MKNSKHMHYIPYAIGIPLTLFCLYKQRYFIFGKTYRIKVFNSKLEKRFKFNDKYINNVNFNNKQYINKHLIGTVFPTNIYDLQQLMKLANQFKVPLITDDINYMKTILPYNHIKVDLSQFNKVINIDINKGNVYVESGISVKYLLSLLHKIGYTIEELEKYINSDLTLNDCLFNNYYGYGLNTCITGYEVLTPKKERIFSFGNVVDFTQNTVNFSLLFLNSSNLIGMMLGINLHITPIKTYKYMKIKFPNHNEIFNKDNHYLFTKLHCVYINANSNENDLYLKITPNEFYKYIHILQQKGFMINEISKNDYINNTTMFNNKISDYIMSRKVKIVLNDNNQLKDVVNKVKTLTKEKGVQVRVNVLIKEKEIGIYFPKDDDINVIEKEFEILRELNKCVCKLNGHFFMNYNMVLNTKYDLMREIGYNNYFFIEQLKYYFDPNYILNPHLTFKKPFNLDELKRNNKFINYIFTKVKL